MITEIKKRELVKNENALEHVSVRCARQWVELAVSAAECGNYEDMMTYIRLAKIFEEDVFIVKGELLTEINKNDKFE